MNVWLLVVVAVIISAGVAAGTMYLYAGERPAQTLNPPANDLDNDITSNTSALKTPGEAAGPDAGMAPGSSMDVADGEPVQIVSDAHLADLLTDTGAGNLPGGMLKFFGPMPDAVMASEDAVWTGGDSVALSPRMTDDSTGGIRESLQMSEPQAGIDYSTTNVQVRGVDEPDYIKNDGQFAYIATRNVLSIVDVWPASEMHVAAKVALDIDSQHIRDMFISGDDLVVLYDAQSHNVIIHQYGFEPARSYAPVTGVMIIDVADRKSPEIRAAYSIDGWLDDSRMIGSHVYVVSTSPLDPAYPKLPSVSLMSLGGGTDRSNDSDRIVSRAYYFEDETQFSSFTTISAIDLSDPSGAPVTSEAFLMGDTSTYYVTHSNLYLTYAQHMPPGYDYDLAARDRFFKVIVPLFPGVVQSDILDAWERAALPGSEHAAHAWGEISAILQDYYNTLGPDMRDSLFEDIREALASYDSELARDYTRTVIHKVSIDGSTIEYEARGSVPGRLLNQFSLGESGGGERLRVATTVEYHTEFGEFERSNGVHALDADLNSVGALEGVAPDESIYSARFMGDRLYMVTFEQIDPFFVIDISGDVPVILGELKIPGFSTYLHPYDDDHVIGIGRDTKLEDGGSWVRQLGIKVALFGVADVSNPVVVDDLVIGKSSAHSDALYDHKAFFFDRVRSMISLPVEGPSGTVGEMQAQHAPRPSPGTANVKHWTGFYIIDADAKDGLGIRGLIPHESDTETYRHLVPARTFYIGDVLYTISNGVLIASDIYSLERLGGVRLAGTGELINFMN